MLRTLIAMVLLFPILVHASQISCYSGSKLIYKSNVHAIEYNGDFKFFTEDHTNHVIMTDAVCIIKIKKGHKK